MLHAGILKTYEEGVDRRGQLGSLKASRPAATPDESRTQASAYLFSTDAAVFLEHKELGEEIFGPTTLVVACETKDRLRQVAENLEGALTATIHGTPDDLREFGMARPAVGEQGRSAHLQRISDGRRSVRLDAARRALPGDHGCALDLRGHGGDQAFRAPRLLPELSPGGAAGRTPRRE